MTDLIPLIEANPNASDAQIVAIAAVPAWRAIPRYQALAILAGSLDGLRAFAAALPNEQAVARFKTLRLVDGLIGGLSEIAEADMPLVAQLAPWVVQAGVIMPEQATELLAAGTARTAIVATEADVQAARAVYVRAEALRELARQNAASANDRAGQIAWLEAHPDVDVPETLAGLDAWVIPTE
jgi:hypothetical protein